MTTEWEYKIYDLHLGVNPDSVEELNYLGSDQGGNWEFVTIGTVPYKIGEYVYEGKRFYFKRPKPQIPV